MWARRCGAPANVPSRVKVVLFSVLNGAIGLSIYRFMAGFDVGYLDLRSADPVTVQCYTEWPLRSSTWSWVSITEWHSWWRKSALTREAPEVCHAPSAANANCSSVKLSLDLMQRPLGKALNAPEVFVRFDVLGGWAHMFLGLAIFSGFAIVTHDLALISATNRHYVMDVKGVNRRCPMIRRLWRQLAGYRWFLLMMGHEKRLIKLAGIALLILVAPLLVVWNLVLFQFVIVPFIFCVITLHPIQMSRVWIFILGILCTIYGFFLTVQMVVALADPRARARYAVIWTEDSLSGHTAGGHPCTCGCNFAISSGICTSLLTAGVAVTVKSIEMTLRTLKGLRRAQWANLMSVLFPVPLTIYEVDWRQPDGRPIRNRDDDTPVQSEVAFDPFALMDEQDDSALTTCNIKPSLARENWIDVQTPLGSISRRRNRNLAGPQVALEADGRLVELDAEYVGCCGFPWPTGGRKVVFAEEYLHELQEEAPEELEMSDPPPECDDKDLETPPLPSDQDLDVDAITAAPEDPLVATGEEEQLRATPTKGSSLGDSIAV